jgi:mRNA interferase YafQ
MACSPFGQHQSRRGRYDPVELLAVTEALTQGIALGPQQRDHPLTEARSGFRECHIRPDWLLIYQCTSDRLVLVRMGSHTDLFG